jgi:uncharacterized membrane protein
MLVLPQDNIMWMTYNISLAVIPVFLGWFMLDVQTKWIKVVLGFFWLIFLPNSIYLFSDIIHLFQQWDTANTFWKLILIIEYTIVVLAGLLTYVYSMYPFERMIATAKKIRKKTMMTVLLIDLNFLVGFGIVLGRIQRINSWDILTNFGSVIRASLDIFASLEQVTIIILLGLFANFLYFLVSQPIIKYTTRIFQT